MPIQLAPDISDMISQLLATTKPPIACSIIPQTNIGLGPILSTKNPDETFVNNPSDVGTVTINDASTIVRLNSLRKTGIRAKCIKKKISINIWEIAIDQIEFLMDSVPS
jgi:hypothetical protein